MNEKTTRKKKAKKVKIEGEPLINLNLILLNKSMWGEKAYFFSGLGSQWHGFGIRWTGM